MNMIKKIALTASILLFVLAEKTALLKKYGGSLFEKCAQDCWGRILEASYRMPVDGNVVTYYFREVMPEGSALYQGKEEMFNSSKYEFDVIRAIVCGRILMGGTCRYFIPNIMWPGIKGAVQSSIRFCM